jgi:hypothetical protein
MQMLIIFLALIATVIAVEVSKYVFKIIQIYPVGLIFKLFQIESVEDKRGAGMRTFAFAKKRYYPSTFAFAKRSSSMIDNNPIDDSSSTMIDKRSMSSFAKKWQLIDGYGNGNRQQQQFAFAKRRFSQFACKCNSIP